MKDSIIAKLESLKERYEELEALLGDASVISDQDKFRAYSKEYSQLEDVVKCFNRWNQLNTNIAEAELMLDDPEMKEMAEMEIEESKAEIEEVEQQLQILLLPKDPNDEYNCYLEIRAGTGGDEAGIFAGDLFRMYSRYAESKRWRVEMLSANESEQGGYKEVIVKVSGDGVYGQLKFESGGHRVQRVPKTESQGRIHTSACTVAVMPELPESEMPEINPADLRIDTYRSSKEQMFLFVTATLTVIPILYFFKKESKNPIFSIIFYVSWVLFHFSFSGIRQAMAVSIVSIAYIYMFQRRYIVFIIIVIGAALIHTSALLAILALPLFCIRLKDTKWFIIFILFAIITLVIPNVLVIIINFIFSDSGRYQNYLDNLRANGFNLALVYLCFSFVVSYLKRKDNEGSYVQFILLLFVIQLLGMRSDVATRIGYYFLPLLYVIYPNAIEQSKHPKMYALLSCLLFISFFFYAYSGGYLNVLPLKMCWE